MMVGYGCLMLISIINQLYRGSQILSVEEIEEQGENQGPATSNCEWIQNFY